MAQIDDEALKKLREILKEVATRANRLSALIGLERSLLVMTRKFDDLCKRISIGAGPPLKWDQPIADQFKSDLDNFRRFDYADFRGDVEEFIEDRALKLGEAPEPPKDWITKLDKQLDEINAQYANGAAALLNPFLALQKTIDDCAKLRKKMVLQEVRLLSELTQQVERQLGG